MLPVKTSWTIGVLILLFAALPYVPGPKSYTGLQASDLRSLVTFKQEPIIAKSKPPEPPKLDTPAPTEKLVVPDLYIPAGSLDTFFAALNRTEHKEPGAVTRILHYGDSPTTADLITSDIRSLFQQRYGNAGHGFYLIAAPWAWYGHHGMKVSAKGWKIEPASLARAKDGVHGLGGVSFRGASGAYSNVSFPAGHTRGTLYFFSQPEGGKVSIASGEKTLAEIDTNNSTTAPGFAEFEIPADATEIHLQVLSGQVRLFGYRFDMPGPGVEYSTLGINGGQVQMMVRYFEVSQWTAELRHENPDLVILNYGTNESLYPQYLDKDYPAELKKVIARIREAVPRASLLIMSPMDRGVLDGSGEITTPTALIHLVEIQRQVAAETGCAFFNTFKAMGGPGTMGKWYTQHPRLVSADFMHPLPAGAAKVGTIFENALVTASQAR